MDTMSEIVHNLIEDLKCPLCFLYMKPPIRQCAVGHSMCSPCARFVKSCPYCRGPISESARNFTVESMHSKLNLPCNFTDAGCRFVGLGKEIVHHERVCEFRSLFCPFANCPCRGTADYLTSHIREAHSAGLYFEKQQKHLKEKFTRISKTMYNCTFVSYAFGRFFIVVFDLDDITDVVRWEVFYVANPDSTTEDAKWNYTYTIKFPFSEIPSEPFVYSSLCHKAPDGDIKLDHNCPCSFMNTIDKDFEIERRMLFKLSIFRKGQDAEEGESEQLDRRRRSF